MRILLAEDEISLAKAIKKILQSNNYEVDSVDNGDDAIYYLLSDNYDIAIIDIMLNGLDGISVVKEVREKGCDASIIMLIALSDIDKKVEALDLGANDYLTKPFSTKELLARINKILLRQKHNSILKVGDISFDMDKMLVYKDTIKLELTPLELKLLHLLFLNLNKLVSRNTILDKIYEWTGNDVDSHTITVYFQRIRQKLGTDIISTVKGLGYRIDYEK